MGEQVRAKQPRTPATLEARCHDGERVGAAAGITAVLFGLGAQSKADEAAALDRTNPSNTRATQLALSDEAERSALWANVLGGVGVVAGLSGVAMVLLASDGPLGDGFSVAPTPGGVVFGGAF